jgi:hypothetical protein
MKHASDFNVTFKAMLTAALLLAIIFSAGCRRKQQDKSGQSRDTSVSEKLKSSEHDGLSKTQLNAAEYNDQNFPNNEAKETAIIVPDTNTNATDADAKPEIKAALDANLKPESEQAEQPVTDQPEEETSSRPLDVNSFAEMNDIGEKYSFISRLAGQSPDLLPALIDKALDDKNPGVRALAMNQAMNNNLKGSELIPVIKKAMSDPESVIRQRAVDACADINELEVSNILLEALEDESEIVREAAISQAVKKDMPLRLTVLEAGITSQNTDVRMASAKELINTPSAAALDILITGLDDPDPVLHDAIKDMIKSRYEVEFDTYEQAQAWWNANRNNFTNDLKPKDDPQSTKQDVNQ